jgi:hypothetical protein
VRDEKTKSSSDWQTFYRSAGRGIQANAARTRGDQGVRGVPGSSKASRLKVTKAASGAFNIGIDHKGPFTGQMLLMQALGVTDFDFAAGI